MVRNGVPVSEYQWCPRVWWLLIIAASWVWPLGDQSVWTMVKTLNFRKYFVGSGANPMHTHIVVKCLVRDMSVFGLCPCPGYVCVICLHIPSHAFIYLHITLICLHMPLYVLIYLIYAFVCLHITSYALDIPSYAFICLHMPGICLHMPSYNFICLYMHGIYLHICL